MSQIKLSRSNGWLENIDKMFTEIFGGGTKPLCSNGLVSLKGGAD